ncbi:MAG: methionine synthase [Caldisericia bacterium]|nr:methionine synthase [Caldisericia bacterium]
MEEGIIKLLKEQILVLDGAMGTMILGLGLTENDFRGDMLMCSQTNQKGNNDLLSLTKPAAIKNIHRQYLEAGANIIKTNTFNANRISMSDYGLEDLVYQMNLQSAKLAKECVCEFENLTGTINHFVAGSIGPTNKSCSMSSDVENPGARQMTFDQLSCAYLEQAKGLADGGVDLFLVETVFDTLNCKAALYAISQLKKQTGKVIPVMVSATVSDSSGRTLSGQTLEAFIISVSHFPLLSIGLNCAFGAQQLKPFVEELSNKTSHFVSVHPNAGLPNSFGGYDQTPSVMAGYVLEYIDNGWVNIVGGCCGTTPDHIREIAKLAKSGKPRVLPNLPQQTQLAGLEPVTISKETNFVNIGERTNVAGSAKFARLIREGKHQEALQVARSQVEGGAQVIDICMDEALLDSKKAMTDFLNLIASEPDIAKVPVMIDSSSWEVIKSALKCVQGKPIVNSISLKEGEAVFLERARIIRELGACAVVMLFDENGQADTYQKKIDVANRSCKLLTEEIGFPAEDIIIDPNVLAIATEIHEHNNYAVDFIEAVRWVKQNLPFVKTSGGISNLSFAFKGYDAIREAMHSVFLYHAIKAGLDMGIVNPAMLKVYDQIEPQLLELAEDLVLNKRNDATDRLVSYAQSISATKQEKTTQKDTPQLPLLDRIKRAMVTGMDDNIEADVLQARATFPRTLDIVEGPLMEAMDEVGKLFGAGKMFLPQVVKSARVMRKAVNALVPFIESESGSGISKKAGKIVLATVKGDVHDIGKNIVSLILSCNNFEVVDLGVMVSAETIAEKAVSEQADAVGLSGLITPSLEEMVHVARVFEDKHIKTPLLVGGATTSPAHTAVKIATACSNTVVHARDASQVPVILSSILSKNLDYLDSLRTKQAMLRKQYSNPSNAQHCLSIEEARENKLPWIMDNARLPHASFPGVAKTEHLKISQIRELIDWKFFVHAWSLNLQNPDSGGQAEKLISEANILLDRMEESRLIELFSRWAILPANSVGDDVEILGSQKPRFLRFLRNQQSRNDNLPNLCLADFIAPADSGFMDAIGIFAVTAKLDREAFGNDPYEQIMAGLLADRLAEALACFAHQTISENWPDDSNDKPKLAGIRSAPGYPSCPDHSEKQAIFDLLNAPREIGIGLTENFAMTPVSSVCGYIFENSDATNFGVGMICADQLEDYSRRKNIAMSRLSKWIAQGIDVLETEVEQ